LINLTSINLSNNPWQDQAGFNHNHTNTTSDLAKNALTKNFTRVSSKDAESFVARPRLSLQNWLQDRSRNNHLCQARHNHRDPLVIFPSTFHLKPSTKETDTHRLHFLTT
jgi:hypothetical protein